MEHLTTPVILGMQWLKLHNPSVDWSNYVLTIASSTGGEVCLTGVRPHNLSPVVELCSAKVACRALRRGVVTWFACMRSVQEESDARTSLVSAAPKSDSATPSRVPCRPDHPTYVHLKTWLSLYAPGADLEACVAAALETLRNGGSLEALHCKSCTKLHFGVLSRSCTACGCDLQVQQHANSFGASNPLAALHAELGADREHLVVNNPQP